MKPSTRPPFSLGLIGLAGFNACAGGWDLTREGLTRCIVLSVLPFVVSVARSLTSLTVCYHYGPDRGRRGVLVCVRARFQMGIPHTPHVKTTFWTLAAILLHWRTGSSNRNCAPEGSRTVLQILCTKCFHKVFGYVGSHQNLKDLKNGVRMPHRHVGWVLALARPCPGGWRMPWLLGNSC